jgi:ribonuclease D
MTSDQDIEYIDQHEDLASLCTALSNEKWICLDTEFIREKTYYPQLCLIQIGIPGRIACIDPLTIEDLSPLRGILADPAITKVFHAASQDMEILYYRLGLTPEPIFDTQIAASLMGMGDQVGYGRLVEDILRVQLDKSHSRTDWSLRPLDPEQINYAADDVRYLRDVYLHQLQWLSAKGRLDWLHDDFEHMTDPTRYEPRPEQMWRRIKGNQRLKPAQLMNLKKVAEWRELRAIDANRPRRWILKDEVMLEIARRAPANINDLSRVRGLEDGVVKRHGDTLLALIKDAQGTPREEWPELEKRQRLSEDQEVVVELLMAELRLSALEASISPQAIATRKQLEQLTSGRRDVDLMDGWRLELVGQRLLDLLEGKTALGICGRQVCRLPRSD